MDSSRFDAIVRQVSHTSNRRQAMTALAAGGLGLGLARLGLTGGAAKKGKKKKKDNGARCKKTAECKGRLVCNVALANEDCYSAAEKRCCVPLGGFCNDSCECCGVGRICNGHVCEVA